MVYIFLQREHREKASREPQSGTISIFRRLLLKIKWQTTRIQTTTLRKKL
jgi:hypothetical protein